jgi:hypothetical protein
MSRLGISQFDAVAWIDAASEALRNSAWADALRVGEVDVLDALRNALLQSALKLAREGAGDRRGTSLAAAGRQRLRLLGYRVRLAWYKAQARRHSPLPVTATVLFWPQLSTHLKQHLPIAQSLRSMGVSTGFLFNRPLEFERVRSVEPNTAFAARAWGRQMAAANHRGKLAVKALACDPGVELPQFLRDVPRAEWIDALRDTLAMAMPAVYEVAAMTHAALEQLRPEVLVVGNDITLEGRAQCTIARGYGVPTVCPMHGIVSGEPLQGAHVADAVLVYGQRSRRDLIALGESPRRIHVCGAPNLVHRTRQTGKVHPRIRQFLQLADGQPWVLLATSGPGHSVSVGHHARVIEAVMRLSVAMPEVRFVAKLHPKDRLDYYRAAQRRVPESRLMTFTNKSSAAPRELTEWLQGCTAVITGGSAAGLDAMLMDVPVVSIDLAGELTGVDFIESGASQHVRDEPGLRAAVERAVCNAESLADVRSRAEAFLKEAFFALDGDPARIAAEAILSLRRPLARATCRPELGPISEA